MATEEIVTLSSRKRTARFAGLSYLLFITLFILSAVLRNQVIQKANGLATLANISNSPLTFNASLVAELVALLFFIVAAWMLYRLLISTGKELALLFLILNTIGVAIECTSDLSLLAIPLITKLGSSLETQQQGLVTLLLELYQKGFMVAQLFFSAWLLPLGYLIYKSGFLPKALGVLIILDFFFWFLYFMQFFLLPDFTAIRYISFPIAFIAEFSLTLWLLVKGTRDK